MCEKGSKNKKIRLAKLGIVLSVQIQIRILREIKIISSMTKPKPVPKKSKSERFKKIYREFSREKYAKYKGQFPLMKQSEIISKMIKEWESLNEQAKLDLQKAYIEREGENFFKSGSSSLSKSKSKKKSKSNSRSKSKSKSKGEERKRPARPVKVGMGSGRTRSSSMPQAASSKASRELKEKKKQKKPSPKVRVFEGKKKSPKRDTSDFKRSVDKEGRFYQSSDDLERQEMRKHMEDKKNVAYIQFFKYYYERLSAQHPRWSSNQVTTIIRLLWKKRSRSSKRGPKKVRKETEKVLSGWQYYRRLKEGEGYTRTVIKGLWKGLPIQSKRFYRLKGMGKRKRIMKTSGTEVKKMLNKGGKEVQEGKGKDYGWMWKPIL